MTTTRVRPESAPAMEQLPVPPLRTSREIQGNVLAAFNKDHMAFRYMQFSEDKTLARGWLSAILNTVSVTADVEDFNEEFSLGRRAYGRDPDKQATRVGVSFTYAWSTPSPPPSPRSVTSPRAIHCPEADGPLHPVHPTSPTPVVGSSAWTPAPTPSPPSPRRATATAPNPNRPRNSTGSSPAPCY
ncbi:hypothetical protein [Streptomyces sioyaensis]|uniref:hypothetical protein n=1 Tax=Streptomyces sioyaensis TaxID=67364 RepID=UPI00379EB585